MKSEEIWCYCLVITFETLMVFSGERVVAFTFGFGDTCAVGCFIDACLDCANCKIGDEQYCIQGMTGTYVITECEYAQIYNIYYSHLLYSLLTKLQIYTFT